MGEKAASEHMQAAHEGMGEMLGKLVLACKAFDDAYEKGKQVGQQFQTLVTEFSTAVTDEYREGLAAFNEVVNHNLDSATDHVIESGVEAVAETNEKAAQVIAFFMALNGARDDLVDRVEGLLDTYDEAVVKVQATKVDLDWINATTYTLAADHNHRLWYTEYSARKTSERLGAYINPDKDGP